MGKQAGLHFVQRIFRRRRCIASFAAQISAAACVFNQRRTVLIMEQQNKSSKIPEIILKKSAQVGAGIVFKKLHRC
jgi:hypothetical protein